MTDDDIWRLNRGGPDPQKVYASRSTAAANHWGQPTVLLDQDGQWLGIDKTGAIPDIVHQPRSWAKTSGIRDRFSIPTPDDN